MLGRNDMVQQIMKRIALLCMLFLPLTAWAQKQLILPTETWSIQMIQWLKAKGFINK